MIGFVAEGVMRYSYFKENGKELTCNFVCENEFVGEPESMFKRKPAGINEQAITDCVLVTFTPEDIKKLRKVYPRFDEISADIGQKTIRGLLDKRTFLIDNDAATRYRYFIKHYPHILMRVPLSYVASYLDITQQSLSRLRKQIS
jgi:CRP-like cAMP-binding protein